MPSFKVAMPSFSNPFNSGGKRIATYALTIDGQVALHDSKEFRVSDKELIILQTIRENGPLSISEIADKSHNKHKKDVEGLIKSLLSRELIEVSNRK